MCCTTKEGVFTWISAVLVNIAFLSLIGWGANEYWPVGMGLTGIYTLILLGIATKIDAKQRPNAINETVGLATPEEAEELEDGVDDETHSRIETVTMDDDLDLSIASAKREDVSSLVNLLYFLSVISLGVTGFFLVVNLLPECVNGFTVHDSSPPRFSWKADLETIPPSVHDWATSAKPFFGGSSFGYVRSSGITLFEGSSNDALAAGLTNSPTSTSKMYQDIDQKTLLWAVGNSNQPTLVQEEGFAYPGPMVTVTDSAVCFSAIRVGESKDTRSYLEPQRKEQAMYCSNGVEFRKETINVTSEIEVQTHHSTLTAFYPVDGTLWFKELDYGRISGTKLFSLDPVTMTSTLHSHKVQDSPYSPSSVDKGTSCDVEHMARLAVVFAFFVSVLPMTAMTLILGKRTKVPSMGVSAYLCISLIYMCLHILVSPSDLEYNFQVWFAISGLGCLLFSTYLLLTLQQHDSNAPRWVDKSHEKQFRSLLGISAVAFSWGLVVVLAVNIYSERETFGLWFFCNLLVCCPLLLLGAAADSTFVLALGGLGFLADAARLAALIDSVLFFFLVFSLMGLMVGFLGYYFAVQYQPIIKKWASEQVALINDRYCSNAFDPYHGLEVYEYGDEDTDALAARTTD